ncbi:MAG TPA: hypothetical protein VHS28_07540 [Chloroflexota bacterium]|nr:hypothetical protein [Chloroflexota bacterium]
MIKNEKEEMCWVSSEPRSHLMVSAESPELARRFLVDGTTVKAKWLAVSPGRDLVSCRLPAKIDSRMMSTKSTGL